MLLRAHHGDITKLEADAIVNAANSSLRGGGGVDGAIHRAAGPELFLESMRLAPCRTGDAKVTAGYRLPARFVIHTVGPVWQGGSAGEAELLASCYRRSLEVAEQAGANSIAFPCLSTGIYGYPAEPAARISLDTVKEHQAGTLIEAIFCCFDRESWLIYEALLDEKNDQ